MRWWHTKGWDVRDKELAKSPSRRDQVCFSDTFCCVLQCLQRVLCVCAGGATGVWGVRDTCTQARNTHTSIYTHNTQTQERLPWAEEVLVSKAELDERRARISELEQQVTSHYIDF